MKDYTYQDMLRMQEDAANRVREMKKRASVITGEDIPEKTQTPDSNGGLVKLLLSDTEALLLTAVLALLSGEGGDSFTQLALLYILL